MKLSERIHWAVTIILVGFIVFLLNKDFKKSSDDVIYTKGIVILDENNNERILIGAPIPLSKSRIRDDIKRVEEIYDKDFPPEVNFMEIFKNNVSSEMNGILLIYEKGFDKLALGDPITDPYYGPKIGKTTGLIFNDSLGAERGGLGLININGRYRATLGLDRDDGIEGISFGVDDSLGIKMPLRSKDLNEIVEIGENRGSDNSFGYTYQNKNDSLTIKNNFNKNQ